MGDLGFIFNLEEIENKKNISLNNIKLDTKKYITIFIENKNIRGNHLIGFEKMPKKDESEFFYLKNDLIFSKYIFLSNTLYKYAKISLNDKKVIDFEYNTIWLDVENYKKVLRLLTLNNLREDFKSRILKISKIIK